MKRLLSQMKRGLDRVRLAFAAEEAPDESTQEQAVELTVFPQSDTGAPMPVVTAADGALILAYYRYYDPPEFDGTNPVSFDPYKLDVTSVFVVFLGACDYTLGPPNDEGLLEHRLWGRGLTFYGAHEVINSRRIKACERSRGVQAERPPGAGPAKRHFIFTFKDETFECLADEFSVQTRRGPISKSLPAIIAMNASRTAETQ